MNECRTHRKHNHEDHFVETEKEILRLCLEGLGKEDPGGEEQREPQVEDELNDGKGLQTDEGSPEQPPSQKKKTEEQAPVKTATTQTLRRLTLELNILIEHADLILAFLLFELAGGDCQQPEDGKGESDQTDKYED